MAVTACTLAAGVVLLMATGCIYPRGLDRQVERTVEKRAQREVPGSGRSVEDAFAGMRSDRPGRHVELDADTALRLATQYSRGLQTKRDALYLSGLATIGKRREFGIQYSGTLGYVLTRAAGSNDTTTVQAEIKATRLLPTGATITAEATESKTTDEATGTNATTPYAASASIELRQPLLAGAGYRASHEDLIQAERDLVYGVRSFVMERQDFAIGVMRSYYDLLINRAVLENTRTNTEQSTFLRKRSDAMFKIRRVPAVDVMRAQQQELAARNTLSRAESEFDIAVKRFLITLGIPVESDVEVTGAVPGFRTRGMDMDACIRGALGIRLDVKTIEDRFDDAARRLRTARQGLLPEADAFVRADTSGTSDTASVDDRENTVSGGVSLVLPLDRRKELEAVKTAEISVEQAWRAVDETRDSVKVAIIESFSRLVAEEKTVEIEGRNMELARRRAEYTLMRFKTGELSNRDVVEAQNELLSAQNAHVKALVACELQRIQLLRDRGLLDVATDGTLVELPWPEKNDAVRAEFR